MDLGNYGIGGNEVKIDASEGIAEIPQNRTLLVEQLTKDEPVAPEVITGLTNIDQVFAHFLPEIDIEFTDAEGAPVEENFRFHNVGDFSVKKMTEQSHFLSGLNTEKQFAEQDGEVVALQQGAATGIGESGDTRGIRQFAFCHAGRFKEKREV